MWLGRRRLNDKLAWTAVGVLFVVSMLLGRTSFALALAGLGVLAVTADVLAARRLRGRCPHCRSPLRRPVGVCQRCGRSL